jgi:RND family efflux transporter MFP subunit
MQGKAKRILTITAAVIACSAIAFFVLSRKSVEATSADATNVPHAAVVVVRRTAMSNKISIAGEFLPYQEVEVHAKVAGYLRKITVDIGDRVHAGQVLATLEVPELSAQVQGADAGIRHSQEEILRAKNEVTRAEANHAALHAACMRLKQASAAKPGLIAQQELDDAEAKDRESEAQVDAAKSSVSAAQQQLEISRASHLQMTSMSDYTRIVAPFDGVVTWRYADTGALVQAGTSSNNSEPVVKLAQVNVLRLRVPVPESVAPSIQIGSNAEIDVQATGGRFAGKVTRMTNALDRSTRTMQVEIDVPNQKYKLSPGMYASVVLDVQNRPDALTVPTQAVNRQNNKTTVLIVDPENRIAERDIQVGLEDANRVEVISGLRPGDRVVVGNLASFQPGELVVPKESKVAVLEPGGAQ